MTATLPDRAREASADGLPGSGFGPRVSGGRPRNGGPDWLRVLGLLMVIVLSVTVLTGGYYAALILNVRGEIGSVDLSQLGAQADLTDGAGPDVPVPAPPVLEDRTTILLVGSDSREGLSSDQLQAIGTEDAGTDLTDTIILLQVDPATKAAAMLSFPRDLLVERCDGTTGKINEAFYIGTLDETGGPQCLVNTITSLTNIHIDHYARVNFAGFVGAVDALGGVSFYLDEAIRDAKSGLDVPSGCVQFDGIKAIQFVRARGIDSDFGRIARQQRFAREMVRKATSTGTLLNPIRVTELVNAVADTLETDTEFGVSEIITLLNSVQGISSGSVDGRTVPGYVSTYGQASVVKLDDDAQRLFDAFSNGDLLPEDVGTDGQPVELGPGTIIPVTIENGSAESGYADETAEALTALGFTVADTTYEGNYGFSSSVIFYPEARLDHAQVLADGLGGIQLQKRVDDADELQLILGSSFDVSEFAPEPITAGVDPGDEPVDPTPVPQATEPEFAGAQVSDIAC